ncbi:hypothetical protein [Tsukamurella paurometabola]|uniref:Uncharacterized protein n=1 Tax=Tsukamurella paurometabola TaxID=2061 RepID=A0A3P8M9F1_TSUPA|nr:hypothetical protein [Tsukamurella paurometabola]UEA84445.1 hypothetical protein LK411_06375 [Tsukamurella paurometabola]VDR37010.1 Uncharacterised protein [Tsukamurella paurometabola]
MSAEAQLALAVLVAGLLVVAVLSAAMAVLQRRADRAEAEADAAVEARFGRDMAGLAEEQHPR